MERFLERLCLSWSACKQPTTFSAGTYPRNNPRATKHDGINFNLKCRDNTDADVIISFAPLYWGSPGMLKLLTLLFFRFKYVSSTALRTSDHLQVTLFVMSGPTIATACAERELTSSTEHCCPLCTPSAFTLNWFSTGLAVHSVAVVIGSLQKLTFLQSKNAVSLQSCGPGAIPLRAFTRSLLMETIYIGRRET